MTRRDLSARDLAGLVSEHESRVAMLRTLHPLNRPALDREERESAVAVAMAAVAAVVLLSTALIIGGLTTLLAVSVCHARDSWPAIAVLLNAPIGPITVGACAAMACGLAALILVGRIAWPRLERWL